MDYNLEVLRGNISGHSMVSIFGHDEALTTTRTTVFPTASTANLDQSVISATPALVGVASTDANDTSAGTGLRTLLLSGLDSSGNEQTETITMNGQTKVDSANTYSAITGTLALTWGSGTQNAGTVWCGTGSFSSGVPAVLLFAMDIGFNKGLTAYYVVPTGTTLYVRQFTVTLATSNKDVDFYIETSSNGTNWITVANFGLESGAEFHEPILTIPGIAAGMHVRIEAKSSGAGSDVSGVLSCELVDN